MLTFVEGTGRGCERTTAAVMVVGYVPQVDRDAPSVHFEGRPGEDIRETRQDDGGEDFVDTQLPIAKVMAGASAETVQNREDLRAETDCAPITGLDGGQR